MDINKQPGIHCENILLAESRFRRAPSIPDDLKIQMKLNVNNALHEDGKKLSCEVTLTINNENDPVFMKVTYVGIFSIVEEGNMSLKEFAENHAAPIVWPYIREEVHARTIKSGLPKLVIIPPLNFHALMKSNAVTKSSPEQ